MKYGINKKIELRYNDWGWVTMKKIYLRVELTPYFFVPK